MLFLCLLSVLLLAGFSGSSQDLWQRINRGGSTDVIATSKHALYQIDIAKGLKSLHDDGGFVKMMSDVIDVDANDDYGIWITNIYSQIFFRAGVSSTNMLGTGWVQTDGLLKGITTGRYGLVLGHNAATLVYKRSGITSSSHSGSGWLGVSGSGLIKESCARKVCFCVNSYRHLYTTGLMDDANPPSWTAPWIYIYPNVKDISAYGEKTLWKLDTNGFIWEAVNVYDSNFIKFTWERRGYQQQAFKDVAVTDKKAYALGTDGNIYVLTGCPIFDFEDNDLSEWEKTGTVFEMQPTFSQSSVVGAIGKVGKRCIDTFTSNQNATIGDSPVGIAISPLFQIRTNMLHFTVGGGSHPNNYVGLVIDGVERFQSSGKSVAKTSSTGTVRMGRYWWDVSTYIGKCASVKMVDSSPAHWGHTLFDDLRASPPCFKGMDAVLTRVGQERTVSIGQAVKHSLKLKGFYTSALRPLFITAKVPTMNGHPLIYFEDISIVSTTCKTNGTISKKRLFTKSGHAHSITGTIKNLLSDATIEISARAYDNDKIQIGSPFATKFFVAVMFMDEYIRTFERDMEILRHGNESASLLYQGEIMEKRRFFVGENVTFKVQVSHKYNMSVSRAYKVNIRLTVPEFMTVVNVTGVESSFGDVDTFDSGKSRSIWIPELFLGDNRTIIFAISIENLSKWKQKKGRIYKGEILLEKAYFCPRKDCRNENSSSIEIIILTTERFYSFNFSYNETKRVVNDVITRIYDKNASILFVCVRYSEFIRRNGQNCYFGNVSTNSWQPLSKIITNVTFFDNTNMELYGLTKSQKLVRLFGKNYSELVYLTQHEWNEIIENGKVVLLSSSSLVSVDSVNEQNVQMLSAIYRLSCCL
ncbi:uncharacterized protein LOC135682991 [Rhopilema esculentum]|uniref:uncharacterized protein LOC135682991 n=1 Tax=Rhopilema esculentum TaxID=499914 RepID=UPI0031E335DE|eukprot:gene15567-6832_t